MIKWRKSLIIKEKIMSLSVLFLSAGIIGLCGFIFKKTVSNDAKNDFTLRDILTSESPYEAEEEEVKVASQDIRKPKFFNELKNEEAERETETVAIKTDYEDSEREQKDNYAYSTRAYSTNVHDVNEQRTEEKPNYQYDDEPVYYEKINDDACEPDYDTTDDYEEEFTAKKSIDFDNFDDEEDDDDDLKYTPKNKETKIVKKSFGSSLFSLIKTFWRGITFSLGALICLYAFYGVVAQAQTSNDALLYSIWLLIGVILIK